MEAWQALILGLVEGLTEYLPVSSTGHLLITQRLLGIPATEAANAFAIVIQAGAIVAVLGLYRGRVQQLVRGVFGRDPAGLELTKALLVAFVPAVVLGLLADDWIESVLFGPWPIAFAWAVGGIVLLWQAPKLRARQGAALEDLRMRAALWIGMAQCVAMWPGVSRSLATILGGVGVGLSLIAAVEFSFLLGLITLSAATLYKCLDSGAVLLEAYGVTQLGLGFAAACVAAAVSVRWMVGLLSRTGLGVFGWWRLVAAAILVTLLLTGALDSGSS